MNQKDTRSGIVKSGKLVLVDLAGSEMVNTDIGHHYYPPTMTSRDHLIFEPVTFSKLHFVSTVYTAYVI